MKLNIKMIILFSATMLIALFAFSSYTIETNLDGSNKYTSARFTNMSTSIADDLEQTINMMIMTANDLAKNLSFMSSLNQFIRDDSTDQKLGTAARKAALQNLYQSPLVDQYYRVSFISLDGKYITSLADKDFDYTVQPEDLLSLFDTFNQFKTDSAVNSYQILAPHTDAFSPRHDVMVYGIVQPVQYYGATIGYITVMNECSTLNQVLNFVDNANEVEVQAVFDNGTLFYSSRDTIHDYSSDLPENEMQLWTDSQTGTVLQVFHTRIESLGLHLYIAQDNQYPTFGNNVIRSNILKRALLIMLIAFVFIGAISLGLTRSIRRLTKRVQQMSSQNVLLGDPSSSPALTETVTSSGDREIYVLEQAYNDMMLRLRDSTINELTLRESTLKAQMNALQTQINPHFIYNTLNIISAKSLENGNFDIIEICDQFASMLRYSTDTHSRTATMQEEIENVRSYLLLAKARYEDNLEYIIDVPNDLQSIDVPKLSLQPLVENALTHGYDGKNVLRKLSIIGKITEQTLLLEIRDNGTGFSEEMLQNLRQRIEAIESGNTSIEESGQHIGLVNTCLRLHYYSKGAIHVALHNDNGAVVTLSMPIDTSKIKIASI